MGKKYCEDCKFFKGSIWGKEFGKCRNPEAALRGNALVARKYAPLASFEREFGNCGKGCGKEDKNFERKKNIPTPSDDRQEIKNKEE